MQETIEVKNRLLDVQTTLIPLGELKVVQLGRGSQSLRVQTTLIPLGELKDACLASTFSATAPVQTTLIPLGELKADNHAPEILFHATSKQP